LYSPPLPLLGSDLHPKCSFGRTVRAISAGKESSQQRLKMASHPRSAAAQLTPANQREKPDV